MGFGRHRLNRACGIGLVLTVLLAVLWIQCFSTAEFTNPDAFDYAQMGREIRDGRGFSTIQTFPKHIPYLAERGWLATAHWPNLYRYPLPTLADALCLSFTDDPVTAAVIQSTIFFLLGLPVLYALACFLTNTRVAVIVTVLYASHPAVMRASYNGMSDAAAFLFLFLVALVLVTGELSLRRCLLLGVITGLSYLNRSQFVVLVPLIGGYLWLVSGADVRLRRLAVVLAAFTATISPWLIRNTVLTGQPRFSFYDSRRYAMAMPSMPVDLERVLHAPVGTLATARLYGPAIVHKVVDNLAEIADLGFWGRVYGPDAVLLGFVFASFVYRRRYRDRRFSRFRDWLVALILLNFAVVSLVAHWPRFHYFTLPLVQLFAVHEILLLIGEIGGARRRALQAAAACVLLLLGLTRLQVVIGSHCRRPEALDEATRASFEHLRSVVPAGAVVASDQSWKVCLLAERRGLRLPLEPTDLVEIDADYLAVDFVHLTPSPGPLYDAYSSSIARREIGGRWRLMERLDDGSLLFTSRTASAAPPASAGVSAAPTRATEVELPATDRSDVRSTAPDAGA